MNHYTYLQLLSSHQEKDFYADKDDELILPRANVYPVPDVLVGIHQHIIPLYSLIMCKNNYSVQLVGTDKKKKKEMYNKDSFLSRPSYSS